MSRVSAPLLSLAVVVGLVGSSLARAQEPSLPDRPFPPGQVPPPDLPPPADGGPIAYVHTTAEAIRYFQDRVDRNPRDYVSCRILGEFHEKKAEETGDLASYERAELALRRCLEIAPNYDRARASLAAVLCSRHKFAEGLELARGVLAGDPTNVDALATLGDALLETGQYAGAEKAYTELRTKGDAPAILSRVASLLELKGDPDGALKLMGEAEAKARKATGEKGAAWFKARLGDIAFVAGRVDEAESHYRSVPPGTDPYHDATAALGRLRAGQGRFEEAVEFYRKAVAIGPDPHMLAALGDLHVKLGREAEAGPLFDKVVQIATGKNEYFRVLSLFYADHDRDLPRALELARLDFIDRKDVYGYDTLAWALLKNNQPEEAGKTMEQAFKLGTKDANLDYHAALIQLRLGDKPRAREHLARALARNPVFSLRADDARKALESLDKEAGPAPKR
jgi:tetratricopeptide (TPR) repeat protein